MAKVLAKSDSHAGLENKLRVAIAAKHGNGSEYSYMGGTSVHDVWPDQVVHTIGNKPGKTFASKYKHTDKGTIELGEPKEVEPAYKPLSEAVQGNAVTEALTFQESGYDESTGKIKFTIIKPGFNKSKSRFYPASTLRRDGVKVFTGAKMFLNHQTEAEAKARPEGNVQDWVSDVDKVMVESDGTLTGEGTVHNETFRTTLAELKKAGKLNKMGISIRAYGLQQEAEVQKTRTMWVESFNGCKSVDFVTFPGAGGEMLMYESDATDINFITPDKLAELRPDLVKHFTNVAAQEAAQAMDEKEFNQKLQESATENAGLKKELAELRESASKATAATALTTKLTAAATLPEASKNRLRVQFKEAATEAGMDEAIAAEVAYVKELGITVAAPATKGKVVNMGESAATTDTPDPKVQRENLVASWKHAGHSQEAAERMADSFFTS